MMEIKVNDRSYRVEEIPHVHFWNAVNAGMWEPDMFRLLDRLLTPTARFVDIGTWMAPLTLYAAQICRDIVCYECDPVALQYLKANLALNPALAAKVRLREYGLSDQDGFVRVHAYGLGDSGTTIFSDVERGGEVIALGASCLVGVRDGLDEFREGGYASSEDAVIKIDIEGSEFRLIPRIAELIPDSRGVWILSLHEINITRAHVPPGPMRAAETIRVLDAFSTLNWYDTALRPVDKAAALQSILAETWTFSQTLVFSNRTLEPIEADPGPSG
jgi:FkbM family methyltransferase